MDSTEMLLLFDKNAYCKDLMCQRGNTQVHNAWILGAKS